MGSYRGIPADAETRLRDNSSFGGLGRLHGRVEEAVSWDGVGLPLQPSDVWTQARLQNNEDDDSFLYETPMSVRSPHKTASMTGSRSAAAFNPSQPAFPRRSILQPAKFVPPGYSTPLADPLNLQDQLQGDFQTQQECDAIHYAGVSPLRM